MADYIVLLGPTASGKTGLSLELARELKKVGKHPEIVNGDSMQLYKGMDIATAKLPAEQRLEFPHHMFDISDPENEITVVQYQQRARAVIDEIIDRGAVPILVGGSMLYLQSVIYEMSFAPTDREIRQRLEQQMEQEGPGLMMDRLRQLDPESAERMNVGDSRRIIRALELFELRGRGLDEFDQNPPLWRDCQIFGIDTPREVLKERINARVHKMWDGGLVEETQQLRGRLSTTAAVAIGYQQVEMYLDGDLTKDKAIEQIQISTARYAKRQMTWFKRDQNIRWLPLEGALRTILGEARL